jgi:hypothetical protein
VALKVGFTPDKGVLLESLRIMVMVDVELPLAVTGPDPVIEELAGSAVGVVKTTVLPVLTTGVVIESVFVSAVLEASVQVDIPEASETEQVV